jgi:hypothetical protein
MTHFAGTTDSKHENPVAPNVLARDLQATSPNQRRVSDRLTVSLIYALALRFANTAVANRSGDSNIIRCPVLGMSV